MKEQNSGISICLAGVYINYSFWFSDTKKYFENYICAEQVEAETLTVTDELWERHRSAQVVNGPNAYDEFYNLIGITSRELLKHGKCLFHGVAFLWRGMAWLITAPSGTGKTTQLRLWQRMVGAEMEMINGDKPVMECCQDETIWIHPSPWNGKENISGDASGKLGGIILLEQSDHNEINRMDIRSSMVPIYRQFLYYGDYKDEICAVSHMQDVLLRNIPVWKLSNIGDKASAALTRDTILHYLEEHNETN